MVLNGDILEYENVGTMEDVGIGGGIDAEAVMLLINFVDWMWQMYYPIQTLRLSGGKGTETRKRKRSPLEMIREAFKRRRDQAVATVRAKYAKTVRTAKVLESKYQAVRGTLIQGAEAILDNIAVGNQFFRQLGVTPAGPLEYILGVTVVTVGETLRRLKASPGTLFPSIESIKVGNMEYRNPNAGAMVPYDTNVSAQPIVEYELPPNTFITPDHFKLNMSGGSMLNFKNMLTKRLRTEMYYNMLPLLLVHKYTQGGTDYLWHMTRQGNGPHLYCSYDTTTTSGTRGENWGRMLPLDSGMQPFDPALYPTNRGVGWNHPVYVFAADWPFATMNHDPDCQSETDSGGNVSALGRYLRWGYVLYDVTTEANAPVSLSNIIGNKDWTYLTHYQTNYTFDLHNNSRMPYIIEIMFFKFKADPNTMNYQRQVQAVMRRQSDTLDDYLNNVTQEPADIKIMHRKRIMLKGINTYAVRSGTDASVEGDLDNSTFYKFRLKRKYVMKRPILKDYNTLNENAFFNDYYEPDKGVYCRIQAFTMEGDIFSYESESSPHQNVFSTTEQSKNRPGNAWDGTSFGGFGITCRIRKTSYFKLDENIYKSYS